MTDDRRELVFVVADTTMQQVLQGFFCRAQFHRSLRCGAFTIDPRQNQDVFVASGQNDPGLYAQPEELVRPHLTTHRRAVIMVDADWQGSPGVDQIRLNITARVARVWEPTELAVIVLEPEIEAWFWQADSPHVAAAMNYQGHKPYREVLADADLWPAGCQKPPRPKEALQFMRRPTGPTCPLLSSSAPRRRCPSTDAPIPPFAHCGRHFAAGFRRTGHEDDQPWRARDDIAPGEHMDTGTDHQWVAWLRGLLKTSADPLGAQPIGDPVLGLRGRTVSCRVATGAGILGLGSGWLRRRPAACRQPAATQDSRAGPRHLRRRPGRPARRCRPVGRHSEAPAAHRAQRPPRSRRTATPARPDPHGHLLLITQISPSRAVTYAGRHRSAASKPSAFAGRRGCAGCSGGSGPGGRGRVACLRSMCSCPSSWCGRMRGRHNCIVVQWAAT